jgi:hypothetical protein
MIAAGLIVAAMLAASLMADAQVHPRGAGRWFGRSLPGVTIHVLVLTAGFGLFLAVSGHFLVSALLVTGLMAALVVVSNAKNTVLGEPLLFSDMALARAIFRHPQFYMSALRTRQIALLAGGVLAFSALLIWTFELRALPHLAGLMILAAALVMLLLLLRLSPWRTLAAAPDPHAAIEHHGLPATLLLHANHWRLTVDPPASARPVALSGGTELVVIVQCESFADPADLFGDPALALPGLALARDSACLHGRLQVSGFGAYTMRTEYGVLFGRSETELGFRRFDPFLTAMGEASHALPARLRPAGWRSVFLHPHDMRFYSRNKIMPAAGFDELLGEACFPPPPAGAGRYVTDDALASRIIDMAAAARNPTLIYAVTIENHGPWPPDQAEGHARHSAAYLRLARNSDTMLSTLMEALGDLGRPALLLFFGDHRPSIPGLSDPGGDRDTPFVMVRYDASGALVRRGTPSEDLTPAELHHALLHELSAVDGARP